MPMIFLDVDLLLELVDKYDPMSHLIKNINGEVLLRVEVVSIRTTFVLHLATNITDEIDFNMFEEAFDQEGIDMQKKLIFSFLKEVDGIKLTPLSISLGNCEHYNVVKI